MKRRKVFICVLLCALVLSLAAPMTAFADTDIDRATFTITPQTYTGSRITLTADDVVARYQNKTLKWGTDFQVDTDYGTNGYRNNIEVGTATVRFEGRGDYDGTVTVEFKIGKPSLSSVTFTLAAKTYTGSAITLSGSDITARIGSATFTYGSDFVVDTAYGTNGYQNNINAGTANVRFKVVSNGKLAGDPVVKSFTINKKALTSSMIGAIPSQKFTGSAIKPTPTVSDGTALKGSDYTFDYENNVNVGTTAKVIIKATSGGNYSGSASKNFTIQAASLDDAAFTIRDKTFTGSAITLSSGDFTSATLGSFALRYGVDYEIDTSYDGSGYQNGYKNNVDAGTASVRIKSKGSNFTGGDFVNFTIGKMSLTSSMINSISDMTFTGSQLKPAFTTNQKGLSAADYEVSHGTNINAGTNAGSVTITAKPTSQNFKGEATKTFHIKPKALKSGMVNPIDDHVFSGFAHKPTPTFNELPLQDTDYTLSHGENIHAGTNAGKVTIEGTGNYQGTLDVFFDILAADINDADFQVVPKTFTGMPHTLTSADVTATLSAHGPELEWGTDFAIDTDYNIDGFVNGYKDNLSAGTAQVRVKAVGNDYTGSRTIEFVIDKKSLDDVTADPIPDQTFTGFVITPPVTFDDPYLVSSDYWVEYGNNIDVGANAGTVTIRAQESGNYEGEMIVPFNIVSADLSDVDFLIRDKIHTGSPITLIPDDVSATLMPVDELRLFAGGPALAPASMFAVLQGDGYPLVMGEDFVVDVEYNEDGFTNGYRNNVNLGTAQVRFVGMDSFTGGQTVDFRIVAAPVPAPTPTPTPVSTAKTPSKGVASGDAALAVGIALAVVASGGLGATMFTRKKDEQ